MVGAQANPSCSGRSSLETVVGGRSGVELFTISVSGILYLKVRGPLGVGAPLGVAGGVAWQGGVLVAAQELRVQPPDSRPGGGLGPHHSPQASGARSPGLTPPKSLTEGWCFR